MQKSRPYLSIDTKGSSARKTPLHPLSWTRGRVMASIHRQREPKPVLSREWKSITNQFGRPSTERCRDTINLPAKNLQTSQHVLNLCKIKVLNSMCSVPNYTLLQEQVNSPVAALHTIHYQNITPPLPTCSWNSLAQRPSTCAVAKYGQHHLLLHTYNMLEIHYSS